MTLWILRLFFLSGFVFLLGVGAWTIVTVTRMRRESAVAMTMLKTLAAKLGVREDGGP